MATPITPEKLEAQRPDAEIPENFRVVAAGSMKNNSSEVSYLSQMFAGFKKEMKGMIASGVQQMRGIAEQASMSEKQAGAFAQATQKLTKEAEVASGTATEQASNATEQARASMVSAKKSDLSAASSETASEKAEIAQAAAKDAQSGVVTVAKNVDQKEAQAAASAEEAKNAAMVAREAASESMVA